MDKKQELRDYQIALHRFRLAYWGIKYTNTTDLGLCFCLQGIHKRHQYISLEVEYPELYKLKPSQNYNDSLYWFKKGDRASRIELLKKAIKNLKKQLK